MSYKTWINGHQILGNNEYSRELIDALIKQGMSDPKDDDWCYEFEVKDVIAVVDAIDTYAKKEVEKRVHYGIKMYDFSDYKELLTVEPLYESAQDIVQCGFVFTSYRVVQLLLCIGCIKEDKNKFVATGKPVIISAG